MSQELVSSSTAAKDPVALFSKVKFLCIHLFASVVVDFIPRLRGLLTGAVWRRGTERTKVFGQPAAQAFFHLSSVDQLVYPSPHYSGHVSTILCAFRPHRVIPYERVSHPGGDGNPMFVDWHLASAPKTAKGLFIIIPGLASWSGTNYIQHFVWYAHEKNFHCCVFNSRGMGDTPIEQPRLMSARWTEDLRVLMRDGPLSQSAIEERCGASVPVVALGFSLGGVIISNYIREEGEAGRPTHLDAVMLMNSPHDCNDSSVRMEGPIQMCLYQPSMIGGLTAYARRHAKVLKDLPGIETNVRIAFEKGNHDQIFSPMKTVRDFDVVITAPTLGYASPEAYYEAISPVHWLAHFTVPVLCISAADDPVCGPPPMAALEKLMAENDKVAVLTIPRGGHIGYIGSPYEEWVGAECFGERLIFDIVSQMTVAH